MAVAVLPGGRVDDDLSATWRKRITQAKSDRARYESVWQQNLAFAAGKHYLKWNRFNRKLELPVLPAGRERYSVDIITQYRMTAAGELGADDDRPELLLVQGGEIDEEYQAQLNRALGYGWDNEWRGDERLASVRLKLIDLGTVAVRCRFDPTVGPIKAGVPHENGQPILDPERAHAYVAQMAEQGQQAQIKDIHEGRVKWEVLTPFNLLVPPGIEDEEDFPWEVVVRPVHIEKLKEEYGNAAKDLFADSDVGSVNGLTAAEMSDNASGDERHAKIEDHCWLYTCYERPSKKNPNGQTVVFASTALIQLGKPTELPYKGPDETPRSGLTYFHWWKVTGRFWGRALLEVMKDPQRTMNRRVTQKNEIIDRGMPKLIVEEGTLKQMPQGYPLEKIEVKSDTRVAPQYQQGIGPGDWMYRDIEQIKADMEVATGFRGVSLGENPPGVGNYSQLAFLHERDQKKFDPVIDDYKRGIAHVVENTIYDMRKYWGAEKQLMIAGDDDQLQAEVFNASKVPDFFRVKVAKGAAKPRSQAAELKKVEDIAQYSLNAGQPLPPKWFVESLDNGQPQDLPEAPTDDQRDLALLENQMMEQGEQPQVQEYHDPFVHIPVHRSSQIHAEMAGDQQAWQILQAHVDEHVQVEQQKQAEQAAQQAAMQPQLGPPGAPAPGPPGPPAAGPPGAPVAPPPG